MNKHTPGPWAVIEIPNIGFRITESDSNGLTIVKSERRLGDPFDTADADARLIAAAPELLEACKLALKQAERYNLHQTDLPTEILVLSIIKSAIAKAEGRE